MLPTCKFLFGRLVQLVCLSTAMWAVPAVADPAALPADATATAPQAAHLVIQADADDLVVELRTDAGEPRLVGLKKGDNDLDVPAGTVKVAVTSKAGRAVAQLDLTLAAGERKNVAVVSRGQLRVKASADAQVQVDGKALPVQDGVFAGDFEPGDRSLVVQRVGYQGQKGSVAVQVGKIATVTPELERFDPGGRVTMAWTSIAVGGALVVAALVVDATVTWKDYGGDAGRWGAFSLGAAGFIGGTVLLKNTLDQQAPVQERPFQIQVSGTRGGGVARIGWAF